MADTRPDDILLPSGVADQQPQSSPFAAFIPISVAIAGIAAILLGGITAQNAVIGPAGIDPVVTGSIGKVPAGEPAHAR